MHRADLRLAVGITDRDPYVHSPARYGPRSAGACQRAPRTGKYPRHPRTGTNAPMIAPRLCRAGGSPARHERIVDEADAFARDPALDVGRLDIAPCAVGRGADDIDRRARAQGRDLEVVERIAFARDAAVVERRIRGRQAAHQDIARRDRAPGRLIAGAAFELRDVDVGGDCVEPCAAVRQQVLPIADMRGGLHAVVVASQPPALQPGDIRALITIDRRVDERRVPGATDHARPCRSTARTAPRNARAVRHRRRSADRSRATPD